MNLNKLYDRNRQVEIYRTSRKTAAETISRQNGSDEFGVVSHRRRAEH